MGLPLLGGEAGVRASFLFNGIFAPFHPRFQKISFFASSKFRVICFARESDASIDDDDF